MYVCIGSHMYDKRTTLSHILVINIVCGVLIQDVFNPVHRDDGAKSGVSTLDDFGAVQSHVLFFVETRLDQELTRSQEEEVMNESIIPLDTTAILGRFPYFVPSTSSLKK
jgi:hypothetical protein